MSSSLFYIPSEPVPEKHGGWKVPLKSLIVRRFWDADADGSLTYRDHRTMTLANDGQWLEGVVDGDGGGQLSFQAKDLLETLVKHKSIEIWVE